jgi:Nucleotidyl transferase AbiEii toxin, Type IV TA system
MVNPNFNRIIQSDLKDKKDVFLSTANRMGTTIQNIEKDFWVCWALDVLFNERPANEPRLLFKGGTSLSKAYGLISRLSEDIDITVFREDIGQALEVEDLEKLSGKKQRQRLEDVKYACQNFIKDGLLNRFETHIGENALEGAILDPTDPDGQTVILRYPSVITSDHHYVMPSIKIEAGAKSALDPHETVHFHPYISEELPNLDLEVRNVVVIRPERTFWDKVIILHGLRRWHDHRGTLRHEGNRISRHYYDLYKLIKSDLIEKALQDQHLAEDAAIHARFFFGSKDADLEDARKGSFSLTPSQEMLGPLKRDYLAMSTMIFGDVPGFDEMILEIKKFESVVNGTY